MALNLQTIQQINVLSLYYSMNIFRRLLYNHLKNEKLVSISQLRSVNSNKTLYFQWLKKIQFCYQENKPIADANFTLYT
jgi:hypothetical protein